MSKLRTHIDGIVDDFNDDQIRVIGEEQSSQPHHPRRRWLWWLLIALSLVIVILVRILLQTTNHLDNPEIDPQSSDVISPTVDALASEEDDQTDGFVEIRDTVINDIPLRLYLPHHADLTLQIGETDRQDTTIIFSAQAADVRADNGAIVGAFVLKGEPLSWGLSKKGYCAIIDHKITIGVAENSPLFEEATEKGGYFFRQYPLVSDGNLVENEPKGKSVRRAICDRQGEIFVVESQTRESYHDFAQALVDLQVTQAISLVGSTAYGWAVDQDGQFHEFGIESSRSNSPKGKYQISYVVWRKRKSSY